MNNHTLKKVAIYTAGAITGVALSVSLQSFAKDNKIGSEALPIDSLRTMAEVYSQIKANYVSEEKDEKILENAMKGMVSGLDPHSEYMDKKGYVDLKESTSGEFGGLGMEVGMEDGFLKVVAPIEDTPAERAGVKSGDFIVKINDESTRGMSVTDAVKKMRGKPNTKITLTLSRKDSSKPIVVHLTRAIIKVKSVRSHLLEEGYGYIRVTQFQERTIESVAQEIKNLRDKNQGALKGLVLDLRDDPGGLLTSAVGVSAVFLNKDEVVVSTKGRDQKTGLLLKASPEDYLLATNKDPLKDLPSEIKEIPVTVLINSGSASASEIVAGALQDHKRAVIVGTRSFGKGSVQSVMPLSNGGAMKLTTALYYTPNDRSIQATGIVPDVEVADKNRTFESREADLSGHIGNPLGAEDVKGEVKNETESETEDKTASAETNTEPQTEEKEPADKTADKDNKNSKDNEDLSSRRIPNPTKDKQLRQALDLLKDPAKWQQSLGVGIEKAKTTKKQEDK
ncbi:MAG: PDZ domain-containing protein [Neisseriaceae bacterium]|nr:PDZ domain-containing protein [Neisseriaceae bacterium]